MAKEYLLNYKTLFSQTEHLSILLVEDYKPLRDDMAEMLDDLFKTITIASNGSEALALYQKYYSTNNKGYDLIITDIQMPVMNGIELSEAVYNINADQQIIVLSAYTDSEYLLNLINLGIAQFIVKPLKQKDLMNALYHVCKKINNIELVPQNMPIIDLGENYIWDKEKCLLKRDNNTVDLSRHELLLMLLFVQKGEQICTNDDIINNFYNKGIDISENSIRNLVFKLRKKLPDDTISSMYGMGYKFMPLIEK